LHSHYFAITPRSPPTSNQRNRRGSSRETQTYILPTTINIPLYRNNMSIAENHPQSQRQSQTGSESSIERVAPSSSVNYVNTQSLQHLNALLVSSLSPLVSASPLLWVKLILVKYLWKYLQVSLRSILGKLSQPRSARGHHQVVAKIDDQTLYPVEQPIIRPEPSSPRRRQKRIVRFASVLLVSSKSKMKINKKRRPTPPPTTSSTVVSDTSSVSTAQSSIKSISVKQSTSFDLPTNASGSRPNPSRRRPSMAWSRFRGSTEKQMKNRRRRHHHHQPHTTKPKTVDATSHALTLQHCRRAIGTQRRKPTTKKTASHSLQTA